MTKNIALGWNNSHFSADVPFKWRCYERDLFYRICFFPNGTRWQKRPNSLWYLKAFGTFQTLYQHNRPGFPIKTHKSYTFNFCFNSQIALSVIGLCLIYYLIRSSRALFLSFSSFFIISSILSPPSSSSFLHFLQRGKKRKKMFSVFLVFTTCPPTKNPPHFAIFPVRLRSCLLPFSWFNFCHSE